MPALQGLLQRWIVRSAATGDRPSNRLASLRWRRSVSQALAKPGSDRSLHRWGSGSDPQEYASTTVGIVGSGTKLPQLAETVPKPAIPIASCVERPCDNPPPSCQPGGRTARLSALALLDPRGRRRTSRVQPTMGSPPRRPWRRGWTSWPARPLGSSGPARGARRAPPTSLSPSPRSWGPRAWHREEFAVQQ